MFRNILTASALLFGAVSASPQPRGDARDLLPRAACVSDTCRDAFFSGRASSDLGPVCSSLLKTTAVPCAVTITLTSSVTSTLRTVTVVSTATERSVLFKSVPSSTTTTTNTVWLSFTTTPIVTSSVVDVSSIISTAVTTSRTTSVPGPFEKREKNEKRAACPSMSTATVPAYASPSCANIAAISSVCSCAGFTVPNNQRLVMLPPATTTLTVMTTNRVVATTTNYLTKTTSVSVTVSIGVATSTVFVTMRTTFIAPASTLIRSTRSTTRLTTTSQVVITATASPPACAALLPGPYTAFGSSKAYTPKCNSYYSYDFESANANVLDTRDAFSLQNCVNICSQLPNCVAVNYFRPFSSCVLLSSIDLGMGSDSSWDAAVLASLPTSTSSSASATSSLPPATMSCAALPSPYVALNTTQQFASTCNSFFGFDTDSPDTNVVLMTSLGSFQECVNSCAIYSGSPSCVAVNYFRLYRHCILLSQTTLGTASNPEWDMAAVLSVAAPNATAANSTTTANSTTVASCTGSYQASPSQTFSTFCKSAYLIRDGDQSNQIGSTATDDINDCIDTCAQFTACAAVNWANSTGTCVLLSDTTSGFRNDTDSYMASLFVALNGTSTTNSTANSTSTTATSAIASPTVVPDACTGVPGIFTNAGTGKQFNATCNFVWYNGGNPTNEIDNAVKSSMQDCIDYCATYTGSRACIAVRYFKSSGLCAMIADTQYGSYADTRWNIASLMGSLNSTASVNSTSSTTTSSTTASSTSSPTSSSTTSSSTGSSSTSTSSSASASATVLSCSGVPSVYTAATGGKKFQTTCNSLYQSDSGFTNEIMNTQVASVMLCADVCAAYTGSRKCIAVRWNRNNGWCALLDSVKFSSNPDPDWNSATLIEESCPGVPNVYTPPGSSKRFRTTCGQIYQSGPNNAIEITNYQVGNLVECMKKCSQYVGPKTCIAVRWFTGNGWCALLWDIQWGVSADANWQTALVDNAVLPPPMVCANQGLEWAAYRDTIPFYGNDQIAAYDPAVIKTWSPLDSGVTTYASWSNYATGYSAPIVTYPGGRQIPNTYSFTINHRGYIYAPESGTYIFAATQIDDAVYAWIGATAQSGWNKNNKVFFGQEVFNGQQVVGPGSASVQVALQAGTFYPLRIVFKNGVAIGAFDMSITSPSGIKVLATQGATPGYLIQKSCDPALGGGYPAFGSEP